MKAYIEYDGTVYLINDNGILKLPEFEDINKKYDLEIRSVLNIDGEPVAFCFPYLDNVPHWKLKDELLLMDNVHVLAKRAMILSFPRVVVGGICKRIFNGHEHVLLVRSDTGLYKDWILPGGFIQYGEGPEECLKRELHEELGVDAEILKYIGVSNLVLPSFYTLIVLLYSFKFSGEIRVRDHQEISDYRWFPIDHKTLKAMSIYDYIVNTD